MFSNLANELGHHVVFYGVLKQTKLNGRMNGKISEKNKCSSAAFAYGRVYDNKKQTYVVDENCEIIPMNI